MRHLPAIVALAGLAGLAGCAHVPPPAPIDPLARLTDVGAAADPTVPVVDLKVCAARAEQLASHRQPVGNRSYNVLALSGGGAYGAYAAGALAGWTETGTRPTFDVVTGVSTGAIVAVCAFLGPEFDPGLRHFYTTVTNAHVYEKRNPILGVLSDSLADSGPLEKMIGYVVDDALLARVAAEHTKGRRLYVGTTHLDTRRPVVWDLGAIAARNTPADKELFRKVLLASASIPGFFPPVSLPVEIDGKSQEELHVDGGATAAVFFRPPRVPKADAAAVGEFPLAGSNLYALVSGKLFADPGRTERKFLKIAESSVSALLYAQTRGDLYQLFAFCLATGMNYHLGAVPQETPTPADATTFDPAEMTALFEAGRAAAKAGTLWRATPPGLRPGETSPPRTGTKFTTGP